MQRMRPPDQAVSSEPHRRFSARERALSLRMHRAKKSKRPSAGEDRQRSRNLTENSQKDLIPERVLLIGEDAIPRDVLESLEDHHLQTFLREPDPAQWPPEIHHLAQYLSRDERTRWEVATIIEGHGDLLGNALERWARAVWSDLAERADISRQDLSLVLDEMGKYLEARIVQYIDTPPQPRG